MNNSSLSSVKKILPLIALAPFAATANNNMCDLALQSGAFNTEDYAQSSSLFLSQRDDACSKEYSSEAAAKSAMKSAGASIGFGGYSLGASSAKQTSSGSYSIKDSEFCNSSAAEVDRTTSERAKKKVADIALNTWLKCIEETNDDNKLYVQYTLLPGATGLTGKIYRSATYGNAVIEGIASTGQDSSLFCRIGRDPIAPNTEVNLPFVKTKTNFFCTKDSEETVSIAIRTSEDDQSWIQLRSQEENERAALDDLDERLTRLTNTVETTTQAPIGSVVAFAGPAENIPEGWMLCDGQQVSKGDQAYSGLYEAIGFTYGGSKKEGFLQLPNYQGYFLRGADSAGTIDADGKRTVGSMQGSSTKLPNNPFVTAKDGQHQHQYTHTPVHRDIGDRDDYWHLGSNPHAATTSGDASHTHTVKDGGDPETRPVNIAVHWIIKASQ